MTSKHLMNNNSKIGASSANFDIRNHIDQLTPNKKEKGKYICPACNGHNLSIDLETGQYKCWNCQDTQAIKAILAPKQQVTRQEKALRQKKTTYYNYPDRQGNPLVRVVRIDDGLGKKQIFQQHWNGQAWVKGYGDIKTQDIPLYRYAEVMDAIARGEPIILCEGESTADAFWDKGIPATTTIGGTGKTVIKDKDGNVRRNDKTFESIKPALADLTGSQVILSPDQDKPGCLHMEMMAEILNVKGWLYPLPQSFQWSRLPNKGGLDFVDWIHDYPSLTTEEILSHVQPEPIHVQDPTNSSPLRKNAQILKLVKEYIESDRTEEELVLDLEDLREKMGIKPYKWKELTASTMRTARKTRYRLELKRLLAIGDELECSIEIDEVCQIYRKGRQTVEKDLLRMEARLQEKAHPLDSGDLGDFLAMETQAVDWIYPGIVPAGELVMLSAAPKCGKTLWATDLMYAVISGSPLHGHDIPLGRVLYYWGDEPSPRSVQRRLRNRGFDLVNDLTRMRPRSSLDLGNLEKLERELETFRPTLVVIDSLTAVTKSINISENDAAFARYIYQLGELLGKYNAAGILIHHDNKNHEQKGIEKVAGSARLTAAVWGIAQMKAVDPDNPKCTERWLSVTPREGSPETYLFDLNPKELWSEQGIFSFTGELGDETGQKRTQGDRVLALLKKHLGKGLEYKEIDEHLNIGRSLYTVLDRLEDRKLITRRRSTVNPRRWVYLVPDNTTEEVKNDTTDFSLTDPSLTQESVELTPESIDIQETELSQQLVNNSANEVNSLVNTNPVETPPVELENPYPEEDTAVSQQNPPLNNAPKKSGATPVIRNHPGNAHQENVVQNETSEDDTTQKEALDSPNLDCEEAVPTEDDRLQYFVPGAIQVGDRVKVLVGLTEDRLGTVEAINPRRILAPYHIHFDNGGAADEPFFNLERI